MGNDQDGGATVKRGLAVIGVDADQTQTAPEYADVYLTSVLKRIDAVVFEGVKLIHEGTYKGGVNFIGTLADGTVIDSTYPDPDADHDAVHCGRHRART